ncbi:MAG: GntR family transcriptional regulator [Anaerolineaceae bacterium]|nr:GntR family transcriptional regulator [Anaerolineaceae bacterium]
MVANVSHESTTPLYEQLKLMLRDKIMLGEILPGTLLPTEAAFCDMYKISRITVRKALGDLEAEGFITRIQGKGSIVTHSRIKENWSHIAGFTETVKAAGHQTHSEILGIDTIPGSVTLHNLFNLPLDPPQKFVTIKRLRYIDDIPAAIMTSYVREDMGEKIKNRKLDNLSFYNLFEEVTGRKVIRNEASLTPVLANQEAISLLGVKPGTPHFFFKGITYIEGDIPVELNYATFRGDTFEFASNIYRVTTADKGK